MPVLPRPDAIHSVPLPPRTARVAGSCDVLVVGGGPAGIGAALGAAATGAHTILVERYGFLGGNATAALVMPFMSYFTEFHRPERLGSHTLLPTDHGPGEPVLAGVLRQFVKRLLERGGAVLPSQETGYTVPFDPEILKQVAMEMLDEAGVQFLFHAFASGILGYEQPEGVIFETKSGPVVIHARTVVDCTGDGDIAFNAGAPYETGRDTDGLVQPMTLMFRMAEFEKAAFENYARRHPQDWRGVHGLWDLVRRATEEGELDLPREDILFFATPHPREVSVNSTRVTRAVPLFGTDVWDLSYAEWSARHQMRQIVAFFRHYVPGFEQSYPVQSGTQVGVRESRRILGDYRLTGDDVLSARKFDDVVARNAYPIDVHNPRGSGTTLTRVPPGEAYDIPLRCLLPRDVENLVVAGRCISGSHEAHSSYRVMPVAMSLGQAGGVCAALAALKGVTPRELAVDDVQRELLRQGADLRGITNANHGGHGDHGE
ncbi:FAD-dependent oxidoreductase [Thiohalomonas denitrificans]|uniref:FAD dependent oxidoreductase n=1 Tax=Thiohalomonas denitrificans TaxID=415747 RepID=A0A1G5Q3Y5_9GAMM|nr:FAD-dependent oxidoreductase [Thiohalomonas denitrificans]SCZ56382.1 FAD dependent oxidoreductase [Thiohalomonas denitrificans]